MKLSTIPHCELTTHYPPPMRAVTPPPNHEYATATLPVLFDGVKCRGMLDQLLYSSEEVHSLAVFLKKCPSGSYSEIHIIYVMIT